MLKSQLLTSLVICWCALAASQRAVAQIQVARQDAGPVTPIEKRFGGTAPAFELSRLAARTASLVDAAAEKNIEPKALHIGHPLIQTKGIVIGQGALYVADTGKDGKHNEPAKIWKYDLAGKKLSVLYQGPLLINSKWIFYRKVASRDISGELYVSDYGVEPNPRAPGTGEGAKVFVIPLNQSGDALEPRVLHAGPPFRSPEGIAVVGDSVLVADWAAGSEVELGDRPGRFNRGRLFRLPVAGGTPEVVFPNQTFVTLIGVDPYVSGDGKKYVRLIDIDGGRPHKDAAYLQQSGLVAHFRTRVLSEKPLILGELERVTLREQIPVKLNLQGLAREDIVEVELHDGSTFANGARTARFDAKAVRLGKLEFAAEANEAYEDLTATVSVLGSRGPRWEGVVSVPKAFSVARPMDPKRGATPGFDGSFNPRALCAIADGTSAGLYVVPVNGGVPATVWRGLPFVQPMGAEYSSDAASVYMTDQSAGPDGTGAIFEVRLFDRQALEKVMKARPMSKVVGANK